jgi:N-formylmaleamate deformylase
MMPHWSSKEIDVNGIRFHYVRTGNGQRPPLVLVHGRTDNGMCWAKTARNLEEQYDIIMPDSRGHGLSARTQPDEEVDNAGDLAGLIQVLGLDHPIIAGHSMGATSASELGARFPDLPRALILEDPPWRNPHPLEKPPGEGRASSFIGWEKTLIGKSLGELVTEYQSQYPTWDPEVLQAWCLGKTQLDHNFMSVKRLSRMNWQDIVKGISCPTLLITADQPGGIVSDETARTVVSMNQFITHVHISGTGHHIRFENYRDYYAAFTSFLAKVT